MNTYGVSGLASVGFRPPTSNLFPGEGWASVLSTFWVAMCLGLVLLTILFQELFSLACGLIQGCLRFLLEQKGLVDGRIQGLDRNVANARHRRRKVYVGELLGDIVLQLEALERRALARAVSRRHLPGFGPFRGVAGDPVDEHLGSRDLVGVLPPYVHDHEVVGVGPRGLLRTDLRQRGGTVVYAGVF